MDDDNKLHACFISYRHPQEGDTIQPRLVSQLVDGIKYRLDMYTREHEVYFDRDRLRPSYQWDKQLATAICRSACMVIVFWPSYLESDYCRREMEAMLALERSRRKVLGTALQGLRLFVPILVRGEASDLPESLRDCQALEYSKRAIRPRYSIEGDEEMNAQLFDLVQDMKNLCDVMKKSPELFSHCKGYTIPAGVPGSGSLTPPFPGRR